MTHSQCSRTALFVCVLSDHQLLAVPLTCMAYGLHVLQHNCYVHEVTYDKYKQSVWNTSMDGRASMICK